MASSFPRATVSTHRFLMFLWLIFAASPSVCLGLPAAAAKDAAGVIEGKVVGPDGSPVVGALVAAVSENTGIAEPDTKAAAFAVTSKKGTFSLRGLPAGRYAATATKSGLAAGFVGGILVTTKGPSRSVLLALESGGITFTGTLKTSGHATSGGEIRAIRFSDFEGDVFYTKPNAEGAYSITLPRGQYLVQAVADGWEMASQTLAEGGHVDFDLTRGYPSGPAPKVVVDWIREHEVPLRTVEPTGDLSDMEPLRAIVGDAHLVSLGEATHGTREFFQLKHRMLRFLVERMGFTIFGIEATMPEGFDINDYVLTGEGDPERALSGLYFWTWNTREVLDMIRWMREYNADPAHAHKVKFYGFDMQFSARAANVVLRYLKRVDPELGSKMAVSIAPLADPFQEARLGPKPFTPEHPVRLAVEEIAHRLDQKKEDYVRRSSADEWALARQHALILTQNVALRSGDAAARDRAMAENIHWILEREGPGAKMVAWAHNLHVSADFGNGMGKYLRTELGPDMVAFGFSFSSGSFQAVEMPFASGKGLHPFTVGPAPEGSLDETLARAGRPIAALDLRRAPESGPVGDWFQSRHGTRDIGAGFGDSLQASFLMRTVAARDFDALFFVERTTSAIPNQAALTGPPAGSSPRPPAPALLEHPRNLTFESDSVGGVPSGWTPTTNMRGSAYRTEVCREEPKEGRQCVRIRGVEGKRYGEAYGGLSQRIDATSFQGRKVRLRAAIRVAGDGASSGARLWLRVPATSKDPAKELFYDGMKDGAITSRDWREYEVIGDVPADASSLEFGVAFEGTGSAWVDDVSIDPFPPK